MALLLQTDLPNLLYRGKVRDTYHLSRDDLLLVATDRVSAFDVVLPTGIPDKGLVLNQLSAFWFDRTKHLVPNHMVEVVGDVRLLDSYRSLPGCAMFPTYLRDRSMIVIKAERIDVECVIRGYLSGSAWAEYRKHGTISGKRMPEGLQESDKLPQPLFTPTTKEDDGHDKPITIEQMASLIGDDLTKEIMERSLSVYLFAEEYARGRGIIIADTKMEFGMIDGKLHLIDELLTPDSSRFWDMEKYASGGPQPSFDKQPLRDWLAASGWNKEPPAPELPSEIVEQMAERYREAYRRLTGEEVVG
ncbi:MAG TPA: phosphoribosylaminoimidazolesuccinocarboxamide synthase [Dehalococcoidia bacterium]|nr:phosphoribosylaminoimidazolesuccinocarboxamide synthase [Dehalococcoidia bacterium]